MPRILFFTGGRADWGLLSVLAKRLALLPDMEVMVAATNMHLSERLGSTVDEIRADGFTPLLLPMDSDGVTAREKLHAMAQLQQGVADLLSDLRPDMAVVLGDRFEMHSVATVCMMLRVPICHIAGGEQSLGAIDNVIRDCITCMSSLHFAATEPYRQRILRMVNEPDRVFNTGAIGVSDLDRFPFMQQAELEAQIGFPLDRNTLLVTFHPATLDSADIRLRVTALTDAMHRLAHQGFRFLITAPNNDENGLTVLEMLERFVAREPTENVRLVPSLGKRRYLSALRCVGAVLGNSSSGIVEVPSFGIPTIDIGIRQKGRISAESITRCGDTTDDIIAAVQSAFTPRMQSIAARRDNPYYRPGTVEIMTREITRFLNPHSQI